MNAAIVPGKVAPSDAIDQNLEAVLAFYAREEEKITPSQRLLEQISQFLGSPGFLGAIIAFVSLWIGVNVLLAGLNRHGFDPAPFSWLQGIVSLSALLTATIVLTRQNRLARLAEQRDHLELKVTLMTEQKVAKLIHLVEELRHDLPNVHDRHDPDAIAMQKSMSPDTVLETLHGAKPP